MQICRKVVSSWLYFSNFFLFTSFEFISNPTAIFDFEISFSIGVPISPKPATTSFDFKL